MPDLTDHMDALNQALYWVEKSNLPSVDAQINIDISKERYVSANNGT